MTQPVLARVSSCCQVQKGLTGKNCYQSLHVSVSESLPAFYCQWIELWNIKGYKEMWVIISLDG